MLDKNRKYKLAVFLNISVIAMTCLKVISQEVFSQLIMFINGGYFLANVGQKIIK